jgi:hypothetical protein
VRPVDLSRAGLTVEAIATRLARLYATPDVDPLTAAEVAALEAELDRLGDELPAALERSRRRLVELEEAMPVVSLAQPLH